MPSVIEDSGYGPVDAIPKNISQKSETKLNCNLLSSSFDLTLAEKIKKHVESNDKFYSLEFFPARTKSGAVNLLARLDRFSVKPKTI